MKTIILASTSVYRKELLNKLHLTFTCDAPDIDETAQTDESAFDLVKRLAEQKALAVAHRHANSLIIGSDQVAVLDSQMLGKPGNHKNAFDQLRAASGRPVTFLTGLCLLDSSSGQTQSLVEPFCVHFRQLSDQQIQNYLNKEQPFDCAGSFKSEGLGITLFEKLEGDDPNSLVGLPLIRLTTLLQQAGVSLP